MRQSFSYTKRFSQTDGKFKQYVSKLEEKKILGTEKGMTNQLHPLKPAPYTDPRGEWRNLRRMRSRLAWNYGGELMLGPEQKEEEVREGGETTLTED